MKKKTTERKEKTVYWTILGRPRGTSTWMAVPYIPQKGRCGNHFASRGKAEATAQHIASRANPTWLPKEKSWVPIQYVVAKVVLPTDHTLYKGKA